MATTIWDQTIDKNVDWGGDSSTGGAPVSGKRVQEFIKNSLNQKFGYLKYDKAALKYYVFADEENYNLYANDTTGAYANLLLGTFDAPAPATITISNQSAQQNTVLLGSTDNVISFDYYIENSSGIAVAENVTMRMAFTVGSETTSVTEMLPADYDEYDREVDGKKVGKHIDKNISQYLRTEGNYTVTVTLTGSTTSATTTFTYLYNVVELRLSTDFSNTTAIPVESTSFDFPYRVIGGTGSAKIIEVFVDGEMLYQNGLGFSTELAQSSGENMGSDATLNKQFKFYLKDIHGNVAKWPAVGETWGPSNTTFTNEDLAGKDIFSSGKHSIQMRFWITGNGAERIYSKTIYRDFVVGYPESDTKRYVYIMYANDNITPGTMRDPQDPIEFSCEQYQAASFDITVYDSKGNPVVVNYTMKEKVADTGNDATDWSVIATPQHTVDASTNWKDTFIYTFNEKNNVLIEISDGYTTPTKVQLQINVTVTASEADGIAETGGANLIVKYSALNRNNGETDKTVWKNESANYGKLMPEYEFPAQFNNVLWNDQSGWNGKALVLSNGATVTFPFNLFSNTFIEDKDGDTGMTFELELETFNVQDDDIPIMTFTDENNHSYIKITATQAEICSDNNVKLKTNFKDNEKIKIAFIINPLKSSSEVEAEWRTYTENGGVGRKPDGYYNMLFICVNGVLDRVCKWGLGEPRTDKFNWENAIGPNATSFTIGNPDGKAGVKLYSMRVYNTAITPEEEFCNYNYDAGEKLYEIWKDNQVLKNGQVDLNAIKDLGRTPIIIVSTSMSELNQTSGKKDNWITNMQFIDPIYPELGFFARDIYMSCQGTSSMQYPIRNLRPYFGKKPDTKTTHNASVKAVWDDDGNTVIAGETMDYSPEYLTEFWPYQEYGATNELDIENYVDTPDCPLPLGTNKKVDEKGFHKIAAGRTLQGRNEIAGMWKNRTDIYGKTDYIYAKATDAQKAAGSTDYFIINNLDEALDNNLAILDEGNLPLYYISTYRPVRLHDTTGETGPDGKGIQSDEEYLKRVRQMRYAGVKIFTRKEYKASKGYEFGKFPVTVDGVEKELLAVRDTNTGEIKFSTADGVLSWDINKTVAVGFKETSKKKSIYNWKDGDGSIPDYYLLGAQWRQWPHHGFTDRWTLKADYAESSNTHNGGTARLWGAAMRDVKVNGSFVCRTGAQQVTGGIKDFFDVRTSCDCRPAVLFYKEFKGYKQSTGKRLYNPAQFGGIYNIMTDKGSTKLFGFEDLYNEGEINKEKSKKVFDASKTQCWECLSNGSLIAQGVSLTMDTKGDPGVATSGKDTGKGRLIWSSYESRWPDTGQERHEGNNLWADDTYGCESNAIESFWQWCNFCQPAINYDVDGHDGYNMSEYVEITDITEAQRLWDEYRRMAIANVDDDEIAPYTLYIHWINANNDAYAAVRMAEGDTDVLNIKYGEAETYTTGEQDASGKIIEFTAKFNPNAGINYFRHDTSINYEHVTKTVSDVKIGDWLRDNREGSSRDIFHGKVKSFDSEFRCFDETGEIDQDEQNRYLVDVYVWKGQGNKYKYINRFGETVDYPESIDPDDYLKDGEVSWGNKTFMEFFSKTKYQHIDVYKCAAYYIYILRFCAVDQVIKNTMMATEGPTDSSDGNYIWWFINYDNDTILGVRNDGQLKFHWDCDRDTYDVDGNGYCYAGAKSVLWNNLSMDDDFMAIVATVDQAMFSQDLLSVNAVLGMYNDQQEGTWCERLYNEQEKIKYLETFQKQFSTDKYLLFMHGTRHAHRTWYVNHRWELYDSMCGTGSYLDKKIKYYVEIQDASPSASQNFLSITAAAKYYFTTQSNNRTMFDHWFVKLNADESYTFRTTQTLAKGDPMLFVGPQKVKVMDFRPGIKYLCATLSMAEGYSIVNADGTSKSTNWIEDAGSMMTKLLIGDGKTNSQITGVSGLNEVTTLEEVDLRRFTLIEQSPVINKLVNLHRWRTAGSAKGMVNFTPASGTIFYEVSLPAVTSTISLDRVTFTAAKENLVDTTVNYTGSETAFKYCKTYDAATDTMIAHDQYEFVAETGESRNKINPETGEETGDFYVFDYTPTTTLRNVTFNNVVGLDTLQFVRDWMSAFTSIGQVVKGTLDLQGIQWTGVEVDEVINIANSFTMTHFTGEVNLLGSAVDPVSGERTYQLTQEDYDKIIARFGEDAFKADNAITFNAKENMFFTPVSTDTHVPTTIQAGDPAISGLGTGDTYYTVVRGEEFTVNATIFPVKADTLYVYQLQYWNPQTNNWGATGVSGTSYRNLVYNDSNRGIKLTNEDGKATFTATETTTGSYVIRIRVMGCDEAGTVNNNKNYSGTYGKYIYVRVVEQVVPTSSDAVIEERFVTVDANEVETINYDTPITVVDTVAHTYRVHFGSKHNLMNVGVKSMTVTLSDGTMSNDVTTISNIVIDNETKNYEFQVSSIIPAADDETTINVVVVFNTASTKTAETSFTRRIKVTYPRTVKVFDNNQNDVEGSIWINQTGTFNYTFKFYNEDGIENYNVPIKSVSFDLAGGNLTNTTIPEASLTTEGFELRVARRQAGNTSFSDNDTIRFTFKPEYETYGDITVDIDYSAAIVYPGDVKLLRTDYYASGSRKLDPTSIPDIYLVNNQGTVAANGGTINHQLAGGPVEYTFNILAADTRDGDVTESYRVEIDTERLGVTTINGVATENGHECHTDAMIAILGVNDSGDVANSGLKLSWIEHPSEGTAVGDKGCKAFGVKGFYLDITAFSDPSECTLRIPVTVTYDEDDNDPDPTFGGKVEKWAQFKITRTRASATSFEGMDATRDDNCVVYAVDKDRCFYEIPWDYSTNTPQDPVNNAITAAHENDLNSWVGVAIKYKIGTGDNATEIPICVALRGLDNLPMVPYLDTDNHVITDNGTSDKYSKLIDNGSSFAAEYQVGTGDSLYNGFEITKFIVTNWGSTNADQQTKWYKAYNTLYQGVDMVESMKAYVPSLSELRAFTQYGDLIEAMVMYLKSIGAPADEFTFETVQGGSGPFYMTSTFNSFNSQHTGAQIRCFTIKDYAKWDLTNGGNNGPNSANGSLSSKYNGINCRAFLTIKDEPLTVKVRNLAQNDPTAPDYMV